MAWTEQLPSGFYRACWRDATGAKRSSATDRAAVPPRRFTRPRAAMTYAAGREAIARDDGPQNTGKGLTWGQWSERWLELRRVEPSTAKADEHRIRRHLQPQWGGKPIKRIERRHVQAWINDLAASELSAATVARIYHLFGASMKAAVKAGQLAASPCLLIDLPTAPPPHDRYLTKAEVRQVHSYVASRTAADAIITLAYTGLRFGELIGLHWDRVDLLAKTLTVVETWDGAAGQVKAYPKSKRPRTVPLSPEVLDVLTGRPPDTGPCLLPHAKGSACRSSLVFASSTGRPLDYANLRNREWVPALDLAGIGHTRLHDLRHSFASWLAQDGVPLHVIREMLGHGSVTTTERYSHIGAEQYARVLAALEPGGEGGDP